MRFWFHCTAETCRYNCRRREIDRGRRTAAYHTTVPQSGNDRRISQTTNRREERHMGAGCALVQIMLLYDAFRRSGTNGHPERLVQVPSLPPVLRQDKEAHRFVQLTRPWTVTDCKQARC